MDEACSNCGKSLDAHEGGFGGYGCPTGGSFFASKRPELYEGANDDDEEEDKKQIVFVETPLWCDDEWIVGDKPGKTVERYYKMTLAELNVLNLKQKTGKVSGPSFGDYPKLRDDGWKLRLFAINAPPGGSTFVKEFQFYVDQGGLRQAWGKSWIIVHANDMDGARVEAIRRSGFAGLYCRVCGKDTSQVCEHVLSGEAS